VTGQQTQAEAIVDEVARSYSVPREYVVGKLRGAPVITLARQEAMYRLVADTPLTLRAIGQIFGGRDHSTVWYGAKAHSDRNGLLMPRDVRRANTPPRQRRITSPAWTRQEVERLGEIWRTADYGERDGLIARLLPGRTPGACRLMAAKSGIALAGLDEDAKARRKDAVACDELLALLQQHHGHMPASAR